MSVDLERVVREAVTAAMRERGWTPPGGSTAVAVLDAEPRPHAHRHEHESPTHVHGRQSGSDFCTHCGGCMQPAVYEREHRGAPALADEMVERLDRFSELVWRGEPQEIRRLRQLTRPPMGRLPGIVYANFDLFWLGENLQVIRDKARAGTLPPVFLNEMLAAACLRAAVRLSKWHLLDVIVLLTDVVGFAEKVGCRDHAEIKRLIEHLLIAVDRVQTWVDRMIPWHLMDAALEPVV